MVAAMASSTPPANASTVVVPDSVDATGSADVTEQLKAFIASVPDGSTISFPAGARYRIDASLIVEGRKNLTFEGNGAEFFATTEGDRERRHWWIRNSDGITIRDVVVRGANPNAGLADDAYRADREGQHGFDFAGVRNALLERVTVNDVYGDFVYLGLHKSGWSRNITVRRSSFERNGRQGIAITAAEDVRIEQNRISEVRRSTFDIEPNGPGWGARRVMIVDNEIGRGRLNFIAGHGSAAPVDDITVARNRLKGKPMNISLVAPPSKRRSNFSLIDNVSDYSYGSTSAAVKITGFDGVTIRDNVLPLVERRKMTAVHLQSTCGAVVENNEFKGAAKEVVDDGYVCAQTVTPPTAALPPPVVAPEGTRGGSVVSSDDGAALPAAGARDDRSKANRGLTGKWMWALALGAVVSLAVSIPLSRRRVKTRR
jgi:hypothetical protein